MSPQSLRNRSLSTSAFLKSSQTPVAWRGSMLRIRDSSCTTKLDASMEPNDTQSPLGLKCYMKEEWQQSPMCFRHSGRRWVDFGMPWMSALHPPGSWQETERISSSRPCKRAERSPLFCSGSHWRKARSHWSSYAILWVRTCISLPLPVWLAFSWTWYIQSSKMI